LRERVHRGTGRRDVFRGEAIDETATLGTGTGSRVAQWILGRLRTRSGRNGGVPEPGLGNIYYIGVAGPTGPGGARRWIGPARAATD